MLVSWKFYIGSLCFSLCLQIVLQSKEFGITQTIERKFQNFLKKFNKVYLNETEYLWRLKLFKKSLKEIEFLNSKRISNASALYGLTKYSDMTQQEFLTLMATKGLNTNRKVEDEALKQNIIPRRAKRSLQGIPSLTFLIKHKIPIRVDWRTKGVISDVNNQKGCGACWAFSVIETVESMNALKTQKLETLSIQQMLDCAQGNRGCAGGDMCTLLHWLSKNKIVIEKEENYPLEWRTGSCRMNLNRSGVRIDRYLCQNFRDSEDVLLRLIAKHGPVAVAVNALSWQNYIGGVIQFHCAASYRFLNHAVQIVGYDLSHEVPHYIVRNSWGKEFGDNGYLYIAAGSNVCGLANEVAATTVM